MQTINTASPAIAEHRIDLTPALRIDPATGRASGHGRAIMSYEGERIGESRQPAFDAARYLLDRGLALPCDKLTTYRGETPCLYTTVGRAAKLTIQENDKGGLRIAAWRPFVKEAVKPLAKAAE
jgi:hypothetical protein